MRDTFLITDGRGDVRRVRDLVASALAGGVRGIQLREPRLSARDLGELCRELMPRVEGVGGLLFVNDRVDVVAAGFAHGVQLGHRSLRPAEARGMLPEAALIGCSVHDLAQVAAGSDADFLILAPLFVTNSKPGVTPLGLDGARELIAASPRPVVVLGGIDASNVASAREIGASGVAVMSAVCDSNDPRSAAAALVAT